MKFGFVTCVQLGFSCMEAIYEIGGHLDLAITLEDSQAAKKSGRVYLDEFCTKKNIPLMKSSHVNNQDVIDAIKKHEIDWLFIIGWSQIANSELLASPNLGVLGMHPTLLPEGRGRSAIPWAILKGLDKTGVTMFKLDSGVDTGRIVDQFEIILREDEDAGTLYNKVNQAHIELMKNSYPLLEGRALQLKVQDEKMATEWPGRTPKDGEIDLNGPINDAERLIRATTRPYPGAFIVIDEKKYVIWKARLVKEKSKHLCLDFKDGFLECLEWETW